MLGIFVISGCVLMTCAGPPVSGYSLGTLTGGRGQEYSSGYRVGTFVGLKDSQNDANEHLVVSPSGGIASGSNNYASAGSNRYSIVPGGSSSVHQSTGSSYSSEPSYADANGGISAAYGSHSSHGNPEALSLSASSYSPESGTSHGSSSDSASVGGYASGSSSAGLGGYSSTGSNSGNHGTNGFVGYSESNGGHGISNGAERINGEYSSSSHPSGSYVSYTVGSGPKTAAYASSNGGQGHGHGINYSSSPTLTYASGGHRGGSSQHPSSSSYPAESVRPGSYSSSSLGSYLAGMHGGAPGNYMTGSTSVSGSHRGSHPFAMASHPNAIYSSRAPSSGYFAGNPYTRGGGKIILVKESNGGNHAAHGYPGEHHGYAGGMFGGANGGGYKIRSVGSGPNYGPSHGGYSASGGYTAGGGHHGSSGNNHGGSFFGLL